MVAFCTGTERSIYRYVLDQTILKKSQKLKSKCNKFIL